MKKFTTVEEHRAHRRDSSSQLCGSNGTFIGCKLTGGMCSIHCYPVIFKFSLKFLTSFLQVQAPSRIVIMIIATAWF